MNEYINELKEHLGDQYDFMINKIKEINDKMKKCIGTVGLVWNQEKQCYYVATYFDEDTTDVIWPSYHGDVFRINYHSHPNKEQCVEIGYPYFSSDFYSFRELGIDDCIADYYETNNKSLEGYARKHSFNMGLVTDDWLSKYDKEQGGYYYKNN